MQHCNNVNLVREKYYETLLVFGAQSRW